MYQTGKLYQIHGGKPAFTVGIVVYGDVVRTAAPIVRWMEGNRFDYIERWCIKHGYELTLVEGGA